MDCFYCNGIQGVQEYRIASPIKQQGVETYRLCGGCSDDFSCTMSFLKHYVGCGGCTLHTSFPPVRTIRGWNIKNDTPLVLRRAIWNQPQLFEGKKVGDLVTIHHGWCFCLSRDPAWPKGGSNCVLVEISVAAFDPRVLIDTTRSIWEFGKPREQLVIMVEGSNEFRIVEM